ncbi:Crp/Fnr family transcriptional regulator [Chryseobacterium sp. SSA4.19]|uniref:Crp/Fnr family transcriptional regulator n=1 Tax=Chryseobacterium sp. SSA4.19 TaxID=2919915 RepID=UPI001F4ED656|nr:Crp/Fnr family transcriptional regulator [Chryseobacterium sp. SSA4.19]MCJ8154888.1 Crp/Fnr family transcriptional regulator [Chryseobacterium sp. SSA4.19]
MLDQIGNFSAAEIQVFNSSLSKKYLAKNEILIAEGDISKSIYFIEKGSFYQFFYNEKRQEKMITDLHIENEWMFNAESLSSQIPSKVTIQAFEHSEVMELTLENLHKLIAVSQKFLHFNKLFSASDSKTVFYDMNLNPAERYKYMIKTNPRLLQKFPLTIIASYLKIRPETLSRVRANVII